MFKKLMSLLVVHSHNIHMYHWNITGPGFQPDHEFLGGLYDQMNAHVDLVTEVALQVGETPVTLQEAISTLADDNVNHVLVSSDKKYLSNATFSSVITIFDEIIDELEVVITNNELRRTYQSQLETVQEWYLLHAKYLLPQRLNVNA